MSDPQRQKKGEPPDLDRESNTQILNSLAAAGDPSVDGSHPGIGRLFDATNQELRSLARRIMGSEASGNMLQPTALVNEAYLRLFDVDAASLQGRAHFMNMAARAMRRILVDQTRQREAQKRGGGWQAVTLTGVAVQEVRDELNLLDLDRALERLAALDPRAATVVELRFFGGLTMEEIAGQMGVTRRTIQKDWQFATIFLRREMDVAGEGS